MSKKSKKKGPETKAKEDANQTPEPKQNGSKSTVTTERPPQNGKDRPLLRAIKVTREVLEAAKTYKKSTGISFYQLGLESITDRLTKEGFLKKGGQ
ncbi:MAG: hypothetical protein LHV69_09845 [Elusimicrobia bacterium]|nr:hypothetical protein [Candidatus Obscuribacterium magneticum]